MNSWSSWSRAKKAIVISAIASATISAMPLLWLLFNVVGQISLPERLTSTIREHTIHKDIFTESKIIKKYEEGPWNLNGDGEMGGTFQLTKAEVLTLLKSDQLLKCSPNENCQIETLNLESGCTSADVDGGIVYTLCVDQLNSRVEWTVFWY